MDGLNAKLGWGGKAEGKYTGNYGAGKQNDRNDRMANGGGNKLCVGGNRTEKELNSSEC